MPGADVRRRTHDRKWRERMHGIAAAQGAMENEKGIEANAADPIIDKPVISSPGALRAVGKGLHQPITVSKLSNWENLYDLAKHPLGGILAVSASDRRSGRVRTVPRESPTVAGQRQVNVWVDSDAGFDDLWAVLVARALGLEIDGLSLVFGNSSMLRVAKNATAAATVFDWRFPVFKGAATALLGTAETAERLLGESGMRSRGLRLPETTGKDGPTSAFEAMAAWLQAGSRRRLLAFGPLTNVAALAIARPDLIDRIERVVWMGGGISSGNHTPAAEFNAYADPEALAALLARRVPITMVELDTCRKVRFDASDLQALFRKRGRNAALLGDLAGGYLDIALEHGHQSMAIYDPVAVAVLARPEYFSINDARVNVVLSGPERGRTVVDFQTAGDACNAKVAANPQSATVKRTCMNVLLRECER